MNELTVEPGTGTACARDLWPDKLEPRGRWDRGRRGPAGPASIRSRPLRI